MATVSKHIRFTSEELRTIQKLMKSAGINTLSGLVKHAIAELAIARKIR